MKTVLTILKYVSPPLLMAVIIGATGYFSYKTGYDLGSQEVRLEWEEDKAAARAAYDKLMDEFAKREAIHQAENERIAHELAEAQRLHDLALADQRAAFQRRLLLSEDRAAVYRRQAEAGAASCRDLASHAARLDRALEEGRGLVRELGSTLGLRDQQLKQLAGQIRADRQLLGETND